METKLIKKIVSVLQNCNDADTMNVIYGKLFRKICLGELKREEVYLLPHSLNKEGSVQKGVLTLNWEILSNCYCPKMFQDIVQMQNYISFVKGFADSEIRNQTILSLYKAVSLVGQISLQILNYVADEVCALPQLDAKKEALILTWAIYDGDMLKKAYPKRLPYLSKEFNYTDAFLLAGSSRAADQLLVYVTENFSRYFSANCEAKFWDYLLKRNGQYKKKNNEYLVTAFLTNRLGGKICMSAELMDFLSKKEDELSKDIWCLIFVMAEIRGSHDDVFLASYLSALASMAEKCNNWELFYQCINHYMEEQGGNEICVHELTKTLIVCLGDYEIREMWKERYQEVVDFLTICRKLLDKWGDHFSGPDVDLFIEALHSKVKLNLVYEKEVLLIEDALFNHVDLIKIHPKILMMYYPAWQEVIFKNYAFSSYVDWLLDMMSSGIDDRVFVAEELRKAFASYDELSADAEQVAWLLWRFDYAELPGIPAPLKKEIAKIRKQQEAEVELLDELE